MDNWNSLKIGEIASIKTGKLDSNAATNEGKFPFFTCSQETLRTDTYAFNTNAVLLAGNNANGIFPIKYYEGKFDVYQRTYVIRSVNENELLTQFLFYALSMELEYFRRVSTGVTTKFLTLSILNDLRIKIPPINVQNKIVNILSCFDDLIEVNIKRIRILEEIAQSLYNEWFVNLRFPGHENIEIIQTPRGPTLKGWSFSNLLLIMDSIKVKEKAGKHLHHLVYIPLDCIESKSLFLSRTKLGSEAKTSLIRFNKYDIIFGAMRAYLHKVVIAPEEGVTRTTCLILRPKKPLYYPYSVMTLFQDSTIEFANKRSKGSTIPYTFWEGGLAEMPVLVPEDNILQQFNLLNMPIIEEFIITHYKIKKLRQMRDILLPRLISGEIDIDKLNIDVSSD